MKKLKLILSMVCLLALGLIYNQADAQQTRGGTPPTFLVKEAQALPAQAYVKMPVNFSVSELLREDEFNARNGIIRPRVAKSIPANITMENSGVWSELPDGRKVWRVAIEAKNAEALIFSYDEFYLPAGSELFIYNSDKTHVIGAYDNASNMRGSYYSTAFVAGDVAILEYVAPAGTDDIARIKISGVGYGYNHIHIVPITSKNETQVSPGASNGCQVNVICSEGDSYRDQIKSVCHLLMLSGGGWYICSGTLINNTANNGKAYLISAFHCYDGTTASELLQWQFYFFFESATCTGNTGYVTNQYLTGAELRSDITIQGGSDGLLLEIVQPVPQTWIDEEKVIYAAWRRTVPPTTTKGVGIHHPSGDVKKILTYDGLILDTWNGSGYVGATEAHIEVIPLETENGWSQTQSGSSGSGLFDEDGYLIGTLTGGSSADCSGGSHALYGALFYHWDHGSGGGMGGFLDPVGGGTAGECSFYPNNTSATFIGTPTSIYALESVNFTASTLHIDSVAWEFEGGTPATSTEKNVTVTYNAAGVFDVKLTAYGKSNITGADTTIVELKDDYITVTVKGTPVAPVANFGVAQLVGGFYDNATDPPTTVSATGTPNYLTEILEPLSAYSGYGWRRVAAAAPYLGTGVDGVGDFYYNYYNGSYSGSQIMYNRVPIDISASTSKDVSFKLKIGDWGDDIDGLTVYYRTSSSVPWSSATAIYTRTTATGAAYNNNPPWVDVTITLPPAVHSATTLQIGFRAISDYGYGVGIDNIKVGDLIYAAFDHVEIWEGEEVRYGDLSTGPAVLYKYEFEGGTPAESTDTSKIINVRYLTGGLYDAKQWVKNTVGEDDTTRVDYVTVIGHIFNIDKDTIINECGYSIDETINLSANRGWSVFSHPSWITVSPSSGTVTNLGTAETVTITIQSTLNDGAERSGNIVFATDNNFVTQTLHVKQGVGVPQNVTVTRYNDVNAKITWYPPEPWTWGSFNAGYGGFESANPVEWKILTTKEGYGWRRYQTGVLASHTSHSGSYFAVSESYDNPTYTAFDVDNWLVTPQLEITSANKTLTYWISSQDPSYPDAYALLLSTDPVISHHGQFDVVLKSMANAPSGTDSNNRYVEVSIDMSAYVGQKVYLAFHHVSYDKFILKLDDIGGLQLASKGISGLNATEPVMLSLDNAVFTTVVDAANEEQKKLQAQSLLDNSFVTKRIKLLANEAQTASNSQSIFKQAKTSANLIKPSHTVKQKNQLEAATGIDPLMRWCGEYGENAIGANGTPLIVAARWTADEAAAYAGKTIKAIEIANNESVNIADLFVWEVDGTDTIVISSQSVSSSMITEVSKNVIPLETPATISGDKQVLIGYSVQTYTGYPFGVDVGPEIAGKGNLTYFQGEWYELSELGNGLNYNWYIVGYEDFTLDGFRLYRQRTLNGVPTEDPVMLAEGLSSYSYRDEDLNPGGVYCYWLTKQSGGVISCPSDTVCDFILYRQEIQIDDTIQTHYGHQPFKLDHAGTGIDGIVIKSTADDIDYFAGRTIPVKVEHISGNSISLSGNESDYLVSVEPRLGENILKASQAGIPDTLLAADYEFLISVGKGDILVRAVDTTREEGQVNPPLRLVYDKFFYTDNVDTLDVTPTVECWAQPLSPPGEYAIVVRVGLDKHYNVIPVNGVLKVTQSTKQVNAFTPHDGDGLNDFFMQGYRIKVFNRYGVLLYETKNAQQKSTGWNGRFQDNEKLVNPGVYYYILYDENGKAVRKGSVNVVKK